MGNESNRDPPHEQTTSDRSNVMYGYAKRSPSDATIELRRKTFKMTQLPLLTKRRLKIRKTRDGGLPWLILFEHSKPCQTSVLSVTCRERIFGYSFTTTCSTPAAPKGTFKGVVVKKIWVFLRRAIFRIRTNR
ncbi:hypothetical protein C5167_038063 [Papaver somniferum]|uniref:Uncharacterized protein n=1 Tax=Papaver somniferum TaxID=3469 RepID=A0A4Y7ICK5_PAPSO|nr:hypothetical protein C5167_038063 [Papaver somniferum]